MLRTSENLDKIAPALAAAQAEAKLVGKEGFNPHDKYRYAELLDFWLACQPIMAKHGLSLVSSSTVLHEASGVKSTKSGGEQLVRMVAVQGLLLHESGQWIEFASAGEGHDRGDKGIYKAITGARKYLIAAALNTATSDDPERDSPQTAADNKTPGKPPLPPQYGGDGPSGDSEPEQPKKGKTSALKERAKGGKDAPAADEPTFSQSDYEHLQVALEDRGVGLEDLVAAMKEAGIDVPERVGLWPLSLKPRVKKWLDAQPLMNEEPAEEGGE